MAGSRKSGAKGTKLSREQVRVLNERGRRYSAEHAAELAEQYRNLRALGWQSAAEAVWKLTEQLGPLALGPFPHIRSIARREGTFAVLQEMRRTGFLEMNSSVFSIFYQRDALLRPPGGSWLEALRVFEAHLALGGGTPAKEPR